MNLSAWSQYTCNFPNLHRESTLRLAESQAQHRLGRGKKTLLTTLTLSCKQASQNEFRCKKYSWLVCFVRNEQRKLAGNSSSSEQCCHTNEILQAIRLSSLVVATALAPLSACPFAKAKWNDKLVQFFIWNLLNEHWLQLSSIAVYQRI